MGVEVVQGALRNLFVAPHIGDFRARQLAVFLGSLLILVTTYFLIGWIGAQRTRPLLLVGLLWLVLTLAFELLGGHYLFGRAWRDLASDYDLFHGGLLPLGMVVLALSPVVAAKMRRQRACNRG